VEVSDPFCLAHVTHVNVDMSTGTGLSGLPEEWEQMLIDAGITKDEFEDNDVVVKVLKTQEKIKNKEDIVPMPEKNENLTIRDVVNMDGNPNDLYTNFEKIGEGAAGEVFVATDMTTNEDIAIKKIIINEQNLQQIIFEINIMKLSIHENITRYIDCFLVTTNYG